MKYSLQGNRKTREGVQHPDRDGQFIAAPRLLSQAVCTFARPAQRVRRRSPSCWFDQPIQSLLQSRLSDRMRLATPAAPSLSMAGKRRGIVQFLQTRSDGAIRQTRGQAHRHDPATPRHPRFDCRPLPSPALVQIVQQFDILAFNGFDDCRVVDDEIVSSLSHLTQDRFR
jgi:hypothetical protein